MRAVRQSRARLPACLPAFVECRVLNPGCRRLALLTLAWGWSCADGESLRASWLGRQPPGGSRKIPQGALGLYQRPRRIRPLRQPRQSGVPERYEEPERERAWGRDGVLRADERAGYTEVWGPTGASQPGSWGRPRRRAYGAVYEASQATAKLLNRPGTLT